MTNEIAKKQLEATEEAISQLAEVFTKIYGISLQGTGHLSEMDLSELAGIRGDISEQIRRLRWVKANIFDALYNREPAESVRVDNNERGCTR